MVSLVYLLYELIDFFLEMILLWWTSVDRIVNGALDSDPRSVKARVGMVQDGSRCGHGAVCIGTECVALSHVMPVTCVVSSNGAVCSGHGVYTRYYISIQIMCNYLHYIFAFLICGEFWWNKKQLIELQYKSYTINMFIWVLLGITGTTDYFTESVSKCHFSKCWSVVEHGTRWMLFWLNMPYLMTERPILVSLFYMLTAITQNNTH